MVTCLKNDSSLEDASNLDFWWHIHADARLKGYRLGMSLPTQSDFRGQAKIRQRGFKGNSFIIGVRTKKVTFYNDNVLITINYSDFLKIGGYKQ